MSKYQFSPSTADKAQHLIDVGEDYLSDYNWTDDGPKQTLEEMTAEREQELLDTLNHAPKEPIEAAAKGTAFNECVDEMIAYKYGDCDLALICDRTGRVRVTDLTDETVKATCEGFEFLFDRALVEKVADLLKDGTPQQEIFAELPVGDDIVTWHGYPDYILYDSIVDLKTTSSSYEHGKYARYWQRWAYPYMCVASGEMQACNTFEFLAVEMKKDRKSGIITGSVYRETYTNVDIEECQRNLEFIAGVLISFVNRHEDLITNRKVKHD